MTILKTLIAATLLVAAAHAAAISWTGYGNDNQWTNRVNWNPDTVPGVSDDVTITSGVVQVTIATGVNSLVMGDSFSAVANLTIFQSFFVGTGGLQVQGNGNLIINAGSASVTGSVTIGGALFFQSGSISGQWTINSRGIADLSGAAQKALIGCQFQSSASTFKLGGVLALNQSSQVIVTTGLTMSGNVNLQAQDTSAVLIDTSAGTLTYTGNGQLLVQAPLNVGTFNFMGGNITFFDSVALVNSFMIPSGSYVSSVGAAAVNLSAGVTGAGVLSASGTTMLLGATNVTGAINAVAGNLTFLGSSSTVAVLTVAGGSLFTTASVVANQLNLMSGSLEGPTPVQAEKLYLNSPGFNLNTGLFVWKEGYVGGLIAFGGGALTIKTGAKATTYASLTLTGASGSVTNNGVIVAQSPVVFQGIGLSGTGSINATSTVTFSTTSVAQSTIALKGAGIFKGSNTAITSIGSVTAPTTVKATIGSYTFTCKMQCDNLSTTSIPSNAFRFASE